MREAQRCILVSVVYLSQGLMRNGPGVERWRRNVLYLPKTTARANLARSSLLAFTTPVKVEGE